MKKRAKPRIGSFPTALAILIASTALSANAGTLTEVNLGSWAYYAQSGPSTVSLSDYDLAVTALTQNAGDFANGTLVSCGGGTGCPQTLSPAGNEFYNPFTPVADLPTFNTDFPFGDYTVTLSNPGSASSTVDYSQNLSTADIPTLTAATYDALQGLNTASGLFIDFNAFSPDPSALWAGTFFGIDQSNGFLVNTSNTATSVFMPANTLLPNSTYAWYLAFYEGTSSDDSNNVEDSQDFYVETRGTFTTGASTPEPGTVALMSLGLALCAFRVKRLGR